MKLKVLSLVLLIIGAGLILRGASTPLKLDADQVREKYGCSNLVFSSEAPSPYCDNPQSAPEAKTSFTKYCLLGSGIALMASASLPMFLRHSRQKQTSK